jgi:hypothetical protein
VKEPQWKKVLGSLNVTKRVYEIYIDLFSGALYVVYDNSKNVLGQLEKSAASFCRQVATWHK